MIVNYLLQYFEKYRNKIFQKISSHAFGPQFSIFLLKGIMITSPLLSGKRQRNHHRNWKKFDRQREGNINMFCLHATDHRWFRRRLYVILRSTSELRIKCTFRDFEVMLTTPHYLLEIRRLSCRSLCLKNISIQERNIGIVPLVKSSEKFSLL